MTAPTPEAGLCASCRHGRWIESRRGSRFLLCARAAADPSYLRYPRLPVVHCRGFVAAAPPPPSGDEGG